tara:strand:- start:335 stop:2404 length:2070 start_codon:yes stop_codon:yes gene_type:complete
MKIFLLLILLSPVFGYTQNGPGGINNENGDLVLWLNTEQVVQDSGIHVSIWMDQSGYNHHGIQEIGGLGPIFSKGTLNHQAVIDFHQSLGSCFFIKSTEHLSNSNLSIYVVGKINKESNPWAGFIIKHQYDTWDDGFGIARNNKKEELIAYTSDYETYGLSSTFKPNTYFITSLHHDSKNLTLFQEGKIQASTSNKSGISNNNNPISIGWTGSYLNGSIAEIIIYNKAVSPVEHKIINNYLSSKYDLDIAEQDLYKYDASDEGNFDFDLSGIGKSTEGISVLETKGSSIVNIHNPSNLNANEYLVWAHNGLALKSSITEDLPTEVTSRIERVWRISAVDNIRNPVDLGSADVQFDLSKFNEIAKKNLVLLLDKNNDGNFGDEEPVSGGYLIKKGLLQFDQVEGLTNGVRFTIAVNNNNYISPQLILFEKKIVDDDLIFSCELSFISDLQILLLQKTNDTSGFRALAKIAIDPTESKKTMFNFIDRFPTNDYTLYKLLKVSQLGDTTTLGIIGSDYRLAQEKYHQLKNDEEKLKLTNKLAENEKSTIKERLSISSILLLVLLILVTFYKRKLKKDNMEKDNLLAEIDLLKRGNENKLVMDLVNGPELILDRVKIESAANNKLNESDWKILNILYNNPSIINNAIAKKVNLSVEGTSSSLQKMYRLFKLKETKNKRLALIIEVARISTEKT